MAFTVQVKHQSPRTTRTWPLSRSRHRVRIDRIDRRIADQRVAKRTMDRKPFVCKDYSATVSISAVLAESIVRRLPTGSESLDDEMDDR